MEDFSKWKRDNVSVTLLKLDPLNPRVPKGSRGTVDQRDLLSLYIRQYAVHDLAKSIATTGYFPHELLIVWQDDAGARFVLEGNRRIAALKLLINPELAPQDQRTKFRKLSDLANKQLIAKVQVVLAPSRVAAIPIMQEKHTHTSVKPWGSLMQADFLAGFIEDMGEEAVSKLSGTDLARLKELRRMDRMYNLALSLPGLPDNVRLALFDKNTFPITTLERAYNNLEIREVMGIADDYEEIADQDTFERIYGTILTDICRHDIDSRAIDSEKQRKAYAQKLKSIRAFTGKKRAVKASDLIKRVAEPTTQDISEAAKKKRSTREPRGIIPSHFAYKLKRGAGLKKMCDELKGVPIKTYPNVAGIGFRIFLEKSIRMFLKTKRVDAIPVSPPKTLADAGEIPLSDAQLGDLLSYLVSRRVDLIRDGNVKKAVKMFRNGSANDASLSMLNTLIHNEEISVIGDQVRNVWPSLEGLFIMMLSETE